MVQEPSGVEQAVSRALRDNLAALQRTAQELQQALSDLVAACSSSRPANALPPMLRTQTAAASLAAALEVLSRFITGSLRAPVEEGVLRAVAVHVPEPAPPPMPPRIPVPMAEAPAEVEAESVEVVEAAPEPVPVAVAESPSVAAAEPEVEVAPPPPAVEQPPAFDVKSLPLEQQELHRRANRVAKVSMQDIKMLKPEAVRLGRENKDLCVRLRDEIEKARREYDRRFRAILDHPVDYFYDWMVEILADGDPSALGKYPYPSPVLRR